MTFLKRTFLTTVAATAMFGLAAAAHADTVDFTGNAWTQTSSGGGVTSTSNGDGSTTMAAGAGNSAGSDWVNLSTPIAANSGTWTLSATVSTVVPDNVSQQAVYEIGFGDNTFVNSNNVLSAKNTNNFNTPPTPTGNSFTGPQLLDSRFGATARLGNSNPAIGSAVFGTGGAFTIGGDPSEPQTTTSFKIVINTDTPNWTVEFFKNGSLIGQTTETAGTLDQLGIDFSDRNGGSSATFNVSLTDSPDQVAAVPEPSTWAMMFLGFAGLGFLSYRKTRRADGTGFRFA